VSVIRWSPSIPREVRSACEPAFNALLWLLPSWCHVLHVDYEGTSDAEDPLATCSALPEYRHATITLHQSWLEEDDNARVEAITHEVCHLLVAPLANLTDGFVDKLFTESGKSVMEEQVRLAVEGVVQDIAAAVHGHGS
jgi:hypothetical protein